MNNMTITKVDFDIVSKAVETDYMDGDIMLIDDIKALPELDGSLQLDMIFLLVCTEGKLQVDVNGKKFTVFENDMIVCPPNVLLDNYMISPQFNAKIIGLSYSALQRLLHVNKNIWNMMLYLVDNPVYTLSEGQLELLSIYYSLLGFKLKQGDGYYRKEVMHALFQAAFYELCAIYASLVSEDIDDKSHMKQGDKLVKRFLKLVADCQGKVRSVSEFAGRLCITPKYLTTVCKVSTGKTALEWIHEYTTEVIVEQLKYSDQTIKEISDKLGFPNISFFGKFVKGRLGISPTEYRKQWVNIRS